MKWLEDFFNWVAELFTRRVGYLMETGDYLLKEDGDKLKRNG